MFKKLTLMACLVCATPLVAANSLTVYTAGPGGLADALADGFTAQTDIAVNVFQATTGQVMARLEAEAANPQADVVISASWGSALDMHERGLLLEYLSPNAAQVPDSLKHSHYVAQGISALAIVWNSQSGVPRPNEWADLTQPVYRDLVTMPLRPSSTMCYQMRVKPWWRILG